MHFSKKNIIVLNYVSILTQMVIILSFLKNDIAELRYLIINIFQNSVWN